MTDNNESYPSNTDPAFDIAEETSSKESRIKGTKAELLVKINNLEQALADNQEVLMEAGLVERETMMSEIEDHEAETIRTLKYIIKGCEKKTGRPLQLTGI